MLTPLQQLLDRGGPALWVIAALSVATLALILWKLWRLSLMGAWRTARAEHALTTWKTGERDGAVASLKTATGLRARVLFAAMQSLQTTDPETAREECARVARTALLEARTGLRALDLVVTIAPLIGLLGTVLGMIDAFQALQDSGARADPSALAGGIWEALLTTAAGMGVAIPASMALSWFDSVSDRIAHDLDDLATRLFAIGGQP